MAISAALYMDADGNPINPTAASGGSRFLRSPYGYGVAYNGKEWQPDSVIQDATTPQIDAATEAAAYPPNPSPATAHNDLTGRTQGPKPVQPNDQPLMPAQNATQRWQEGATRRYYQRKLNRDVRGEAGHLMRRIVPGDANIPGYGTPAAPPQGLVSGAQANGPMTSTAMGYGGTSGIKFNNSPSGWSPF